MDSREGFTLVELLVALVIGAISVMIAAATFGSVTDSLGRIIERTEGEAVGLAWLRDALHSVGSSTGQASFIGTADSMRFSATLWTPAGWPESEDVTVAFNDGLLEFSAGSHTYVFPDTLASASFDYLTARGSESPWLLRFDAAAGAPLAVRLRRDWPSGRGDTTLFLVGVPR